MPVNIYLSREVNIDSSLMYEKQELLMTQIYN